jgi:hypothetical protein
MKKKLTITSVARYRLCAHRSFTGVIEGGGVENWLLILNTDRAVRDGVRGFETTYRYLDILFTKQSTQELFTPQLRKITNTITDIVGKVEAYFHFCLFMYVRDQCRE